MKRMCIFAALLAVLLAVPAFALESANNHPGGPFLYPIMEQADDAQIDLPHLYSGDTAAAPAAPYDALWRAFFSGGQDVDWDRVYAMFPGEWQARGAEYPDRSAVFPLYRYEGGIRALAAELAGGKTLQSVMFRPGEGREDFTLYGVVLNRKTDGTPSGVALMQNAVMGAGKKPYWMVYQPQPFGAPESGGNFDANAVLRLDEGLQRQLDASGLDLPRTAAYSLNIAQYAGGILFTDGKKEYFLPLYSLMEADRSAYHPQTVTPPAGYYKDTRFTVPREQSRLAMGRLTPCGEVAADLKRMAGGEWLTLWTKGTDKTPMVTG